MTMTSPTPRRKPVNKKVLIAGGIGAAIIVWYVYKKQVANSAASSSTDTSGQTDYSGYGSYTPATAGTYYDPTTGQYIATGGVAQQIVTAPSTNVAWFQASLAYLVSQSYDPVTASTALGKYIAGAALTNDELNIVQAAIGAEGQPPVQVPPPHLAPPTGQTQPTVLATPQMAIGRKGPTSATLAWTTVPGATSYHVHRYMGGIAVLVGPTPKNTYTTPVHGTYSVSAFGSMGAHSGESNKVTI